MALGLQMGNGCAHACQTISIVLKTAFQIVLDAWRDSMVQLNPTGTAQDVAGGIYRRNSNKAPSPVSQQRARQWRVTTAVSRCEAQLSLDVSPFIC
jgi:hypothetical protein